MTLLRTNVADDANKEWRDVVDHRWRIDALAAADECDAQAIIVRTWRGGGYEDSASTFSMELRGQEIDAQAGTAKPPLWNGPWTVP